MTQPVRAVSAAAALPLVLALALLPVLVQLWRGVPLGALNSGYDADFALNALQLFIQELAAGHLPPRWVAGDHDGFGSPLFYNYVPFAWALSLPFVALGLPLDKALVAAVALARAAAFAGAWLWLRPLVRDPRLAALGAGLFVLAPFVATNSALQRFAFSESVAVAFLPLCLIGVDRPGPRLARVLIGSLGFAGLAATHAPSTLIAGIVVSGYALAVRGPRGLAETLAAGALGAALAGSVLVPSLLLRGWTSPQWQWPAWLAFDMHALFSPGNLDYLARFGNWGSKLLLYAAWGLDVVLLWLLARNWAVLARQERGLVLVLGVVLFCVTWPPAVVLARIPGVRAVQFPWRALGAAALLAGAAAALAAARAPRLRPWFAALLVALSLGQVTVMVADHLLPTGTWLGRRWLLPQFAASSAERLAARDVDRSGRPEQLPRWADEAGWPPGRPSDPAEVFTGITSRFAVPEYGHPAVVRGAARLEIQEGNGRFAFRGEVDSPDGATVRLPEFFWPAFRTTVGLLEPDPATGLMLLSLPAGTVSGQVVVATTGAERLGYLASALGLLAWTGALGWAVLGTRSRRARE